VHRDRRDISAASLVVYFTTGQSLSAAAGIAAPAQTEVDAGVWLEGVASTGIPGAAALQTDGTEGIDAAASVLAPAPPLMIGAISALSALATTTLSATATLAELGTLEIGAAASLNPIMTDVNEAEERALRVTPGKRRTHVSVPYRDPVDDRTDRSDRW
jgi:hypothetical protein